MYIAEILNGTASNRAKIIRELAGLYRISAILACVLSKYPTHLISEDSSSVHRTSKIPIISYLKCFILFSRNSSLLAVHSVCTFHVPTVKVFFISFRLNAFLSCMNSLQSSIFRLCHGCTAEDADCVYLGAVRAGIVSY